MNSKAVAFGLRDPHAVEEVYTQDPREYNVSDKAERQENYCFYVHEQIVQKIYCLIAFIFEHLNEQDNNLICTHRCILEILHLFPFLSYIILHGKKHVINISITSK